MNEEVKVKRPRGNPNFGKKKEEIKPVADPLKIVAASTGPVYQYQYVDSERHVWLKLYCAIISTYNVSGVAVMKAAAEGADVALKEYQKRYVK